MYTIMLSLVVFGNTLGLLPLTRVSLLFVQTLRLDKIETAALSGNRTLAYQHEQESEDEFDAEIDEGLDEPAVPNAPRNSRRLRRIDDEDVTDSECPRNTYSWI